MGTNTALLPDDLPYGDQNEAHQFMVSLYAHLLGKQPQDNQQYARFTAIANDHDLRMLACLSLN